MEISIKQLTELTNLIGKDELVKIIPDAFIPPFNKSKIYIFFNMYNIYKLHRVEGDKYAWIDMTTSNCFANGVGSAEAMIKYAGKDLMIFDTYNDYIRWANSLILL